jgi:hypothetical protein
MNFSDGTQVKVGDKVRFLNNVTGVVVCSIDTDEYTPEFSKDDWEYLKKGIMIKTEELGLVHFSEGDGQIEKL